ncbi:MAG: ribbon-helix-helix domain-containing protein [Hyphomicrobiaceae bacterium]
MPRPVKRSFTIGGHRTSISLEAPFWEALRDISKREKRSLAQLVQQVDAQRDDDGGLSSSVRIWILRYFWQEPQSAKR